MKTLLFFTVITAFFFSCKKDKDCERNNYGEVKFNFFTTSAHDMFIVNTSNFDSRMKYFAASMTTDTIRLGPGPYHFFITSYNSLGQATYTDSSHYHSVSQCATTTVDVTH
jgi:hypothetical protein